ncbi:MAG: hypothetical protein IPK58_24385 [Acidobacteria bacterium]|nr:hypothetical protein [Acidobacteriota bacterium]
MCIITGVFAFLFCLKLLAIGNAIRWMIKRGTAYRKSCEEQRPNTPDEFFGKFDQLDAQFLPFGLKDYRLRRTIGLRKTRFGKYVLRSFQNVLFRFNRLAVITFLYVIAGLSFSSSDSCFTQPGWMLFGLILLVLLGNIALSVEAIISYTILGNYAILFHMLTPAETSWDAAELRFREIWVFVSKFLASIGSGAVAVFVTHVTSHGFSHLQPYDPKSIVNWLELLF